MQLVFRRDMIILIRHKVDWGLIFQLNQAQINKDNIRENINKFTMPINLEIKLCSIIILHANMKFHIRVYL